MIIDVCYIEMKTVSGTYYVNKLIINVDLITNLKQINFFLWKNNVIIYNSKTKLGHSST